MRIGLLIYGTLEPLSGGYLYDRIMVEHFRAQGDEVEIISLPWRSFFQHTLDNFSLELYRRLKKLQVDVLLQDELNHPSVLLVNRWLKRKAPYPIVGLIHLLKYTEPRPGWKNSIYREMERFYLRPLDGYIYNSLDSERLVQSLVGVGKPRVVATPAGDRLPCTLTDGEILARAHQPGPLKLLFLGNMIERKGLDVLLRALGRLSGSGWRLDVVGRMDMEPGHIRLVEDLARPWTATGQVVFHGPKYGEELRTFLETGHVLVLPSYYEGFGIVYLEGMGFGLPAIGTQQGAAGEIIEDGVSGYLIEPGNDKQLANILGRLARDRNLLADISLAARRRFAHFPGWEVNMEKIRLFLMKIARAHRPPMVL